MRKHSDQLSLYRITHLNGKCSYTLAMNLVDAVNISVSVLPCGFLCTAEKVEWVRELTVTDKAYE